MGNAVQISFDSADPPALARFWAVALGYVEQPPPEGYDSWEAFAHDQGLPPEALGDYAAVVDPAGAGPRLFFQRVPEPKAAKNRVHLDVSAPSPRGGTGDRRAEVEAHAALLEANGATRVDAREAMGEFWIVLQDPEGNELCVQ